MIPSTDHLAELHFSGGMEPRQPQLSRFFFTFYPVGTTVKLKKLLVVLDVRPISAILGFQSRSEISLDCIFSD